ncbi:hypothetical protein ES703_74028 [subsurface metagenome]
MSIANVLGLETDYETANGQKQAGLYATGDNNDRNDKKTTENK